MAIEFMKVRKQKRKLQDAIVFGITRYIQIQTFTFDSLKPDEPLVMRFTGKDLPKMARWIAKLITSELDQSEVTAILDEIKKGQEYAKD